MSQFRAAKSLISSISFSKGYDQKVNKTGVFTKFGYYSNVLLKITNLVVNGNFCLFKTEVLVE